MTKQLTSTNVADFIAALADVAPPAGGGSYAFAKADGGCRGFVQFIICSPSSLAIHRLWTLEPGNGHGSSMLRSLCELADLHGVELVLKVLPFGRKPYPMSREQLKTWYVRHGFTGPRWKMLRRPAAVHQA